MQVRFLWSKRREPAAGEIIPQLKETKSPTGWKMSEQADIFSGVP